MPSRVLVDLLGFTGSRGGTETYARELLTRLPALMPDTRFAALTGRAGTEPVRDFFPGRVHTLPWVGADPATWAVGAVFGTDVFARRNAADLIWAPANFGPVFRGVPRVVTVHDAIYDEVPGSIAQRLQRSATSFLVTRSTRTADRVLTVSNAAAEAIRTHLGVDRSRIDVVHNGSGDPHPVAEPWATLVDLDIPRGRRIVLSAGNRMPHKNFSGLLAGLAAIPRGRRPLTIIAGSRAPDPLASEVERLDLYGDVILPGWVDDRQLEALYQVADLYVCPSLAEGFGLPVVDALRRGVPVVTHDVPVLREVGGDSARYTDATDAAALADAIADVLDDPPGEAVRSGAIEWAARFTWDAAAAGTASVLQDTFQAGGR